MNPDAEFFARDRLVARLDLNAAVPLDMLAYRFDPVLRQVEQPARRATLSAARSQRGEHPCYTLDIHLQGERETVFLDI
jgi:protocatechuate 3,4-dioxygenase beta subunit